MKAAKDFNHLGVEYKGGQELKPSAFSADDLKGLVNKGLIVEDKQKSETVKVRRSKKK